MSNLNGHSLDTQSLCFELLVHQLSLAIGKEGQNARLSAKLTGWRIDIKSETQAKETNFLEYDEIHMNLVENKQENETESEQERMLRLCQEAFADLEEPEEKQEIEEISEEIENNISEQFDEMIE